MKWWLVITEETSGYDCNGHMVPNIVAANNKEEALSFFSIDPDWQQKPIVTELVLPDLSRKRKPFLFRI